MQKFIEADYYELDWYYEECTDGKYFFLASRCGIGARKSRASLLSGLRSDAAWARRQPGVAELPASLLRLSIPCQHATAACCLAAACAKGVAEGHVCDASGLWAGGEGFEMPTLCNNRAGFEYTYRKGLCEFEF